MNATQTTSHPTNADGSPDWNNFSEADWANFDWDVVPVNADEESARCNAAAETDWRQYCEMDRWARENPEEAAAQAAEWADCYRAWDA